MIDSPQKIKNISAIALLSILLLLAVSSTALFTSRFSKSEGQTEFTARQTPRVSYNLSVFSDIKIVAHAAFVHDYVTGEVLYAKNENSQLPLASLTKVMSALVARESLSDNTLIVIDKRSLETAGESGFEESERWRLDDLLRFSLLESSNDGIAAVAEAFNHAEESPLSFLEAMNTKARDLGLSQTYFLTETGLDESENRAGGYGSARDVSTLLFEAYRRFPSLFDITGETRAPFHSFDNISRMAKNTNQSLGEIPATVISKTGYTDLAGGNLAVILEAGPMHPVSIVVLGSTEAARFSDVISLSRAVLQSISTLMPSETRVP